jgi:amidase
MNSRSAVRPYGAAARQNLANEFARHNSSGSPATRMARAFRLAAASRKALKFLRFTAVFDYSGSPTITRPAGMASDQMPLSMRLIGPRRSEHELSRAGHVFQSAADWPPI